MYKENLFDKTIIGVKKIQVKCNFFTFLLNNEKECDIMIENRCGGNGYMLKEFRVENFRCFENEVVLNFCTNRDYQYNEKFIKNGLVNKMLMYGENSSGKSNLGFALMNISEHLFDGVRMMSYDSFLNRNSTSQFAKFTYLFLLGGKEIKYVFKKNSKRELVFEEITENDNLLFRYDFITNEIVNRIDGAQNLNLKGNNSNNISRIKFIANTSIDLNDNSTVKLITDFAENMLWFRSVRSFEYISPGVKAENIGEYIINNNLVPELERFFKSHNIMFDLIVEELSDKKFISVKYKNGNLPLQEVASTGTVSLWLFFYWMEKMKNISFLFIDEFDAFYHYDLAESLMKFINNKSNFQSILTTHNSYLVGNDLLRPDCYYKIKKGKIDSFSNLTKKTLRQAHNLEKMMLGGEFE